MIKNYIIVLLFLLAQPILHGTQQKATQPKQESFWTTKKIVAAVCGGFSITIGTGLLIYSTIQKIKAAALHKSELIQRNEQIKLHLAKLPQNFNYQTVKAIFEKVDALDKTYDLQSYPLNQQFLFEAIYNNDVDTINILGRHGFNFDVNYNNQTPLTHAIYGCTASPQVINVLVDNGALVNQCNSSGDTPLSLAVWGSNTDLIEALLDKGADIDLETTDGFKLAPLPTAIIYGSEKVALLLIKRKAKVNMPSGYDKYTPLMFAITRERTALIEPLLEAGADVYLKCNGFNALHRAKGHHEIQQIIDNYMQKYPEKFKQPE